MVGFAGQIELDLPVILSGISRSFSVGLSNWEETWAATRIHGRAKRQVEEMFQEERPLQ